MSSRFSLVNTLVKNKFKAVAFSKSVHALVPSQDYRLGIEGFTLVFDCPYIFNRPSACTQ